LTRAGILGLRFSESCHLHWVPGVAYRKPMPELSVRKITLGEACGTISPTTLAFQKNTHIKRPTETIPLLIIATVLDTFSIPRELFLRKLV
jgi:hypothetical protein